MSEVVQIQKTIYGLQGINSVINTNFSELVPPQPATGSVNDSLTVDEFFNQYNNIFFDIPPSGSDNSHLGLATRSLEYLGLSLPDLQEEISSLRQENVELKNQVLTLSNTKIGDLV